MPLTSGLSGIHSPTCANGALRNMNGWSWSKAAAHCCAIATAANTSMVIQSIWTNIHGHNHPHINAAIRRQLSRVAHTSFLGCTNPAAIEFAQAIVALFPDTPLTKVFFSDDGSTGIEVAIRVADQYWRLRRSRRYQFIAFRSGYHGDTAGAASLGAASMFQTRSSRWNFPAIQVSDFNTLSALTPAEIAKIAAVVIEPPIQGAAGMRVWTSGTLRAVRDWCSRTDTL